MGKLTTSALRQELGDALNRVAYTGERIILEKRGKEVAALVPMEDLALLRQLEDHVDLDAARKALTETDSVSWDEVKKQLGL
ncbi:MAG: type II toxin-antitoxin system Phd/YefM family antitoxin [Gemmatimonadetes bacterium]|jgi:prevent-host-death family protein|nr:type II toxin-antitoxin system Phd/YefM family antitoxin [Gemmatimonadota bacterium]MBT6146102.1 type II toxin-antitoxin system Phd/YefM family antitoxin [Gemmatimonadota bacterium]MBT7863529.1 type II toxin-antitoxin system Phd/YefM family antitoxin [Gemmatimonadota bacterium]